MNHKFMKVEEELIFENVSLVLLTATGILYNSYYEDFVYINNLLTFPSVVS